MLLLRVVATIRQVIRQLKLFLIRANTATGYILVEDNFGSKLNFAFSVNKLTNFPLM